MITLGAQQLRDDRGPPSSRICLAKGEVLYRQDDRAECWFEVVSGIVRTCRLYPDGRRQLMGFFYPGDAFGVDHLLYKASAEAVTDMVAVDRRLRSDFAADDDALQRALRSAEDCIFLLGHRTAAERIAAFLIALDRRITANGLLTLPMSRSDIADHLGLTIETVSRTISEFVRRKLIMLESPQRLRILDIARLRAVAGDGEFEAMPLRLAGADGRAPTNPDGTSCYRGS